MTLMKITFNLEGCEEQVVAEESAACGFSVTETRTTGTGYNLYIPSRSSYHVKGF
jgi:hypothetical protein